MEIVQLFVFGVISLVWAALWVFTYRTLTLKRFIVHTAVFVILSAVVAWLVLQFTFMPIDSTYSASNIGALGFLYMSFLIFFISACLIAFGITLGKLIGKKKDETSGEQE